MNESICIRNANVVDTSSGKIISNRDVMFKDGRIAAIEVESQSWEGEVLDVDGQYLCPGLIDSHVHFFFDSSANTRMGYLESDVHGKMKTARKNARIAIEHGITTMRDCAAPAPLIFDLKREIDQGNTPGPHIMCSGPALMRPKGHCHFVGGYEVQTVQDVRSHIEKNLRNGAEFVKLMASGGGLTPGTVPHNAELSSELMKEAAEIAHANGVQITAHCHATESITRSIEAGLDMIEHAGFVEPPSRYRYKERIAKQILDQGIVVVPTVFISYKTHNRFAETPPPSTPHDLAALELLAHTNLKVRDIKVKERLEGRLINTGHFYRLGMKIMGGTDAGCTYMPFNSIVDEILLFTSIGMTNEEALRTITSDGAEYMNLSDVGRISVGCRSDAILLESNPLADLNALRKPLRVFKDGKIVFDRECST